MIAEHEATIAEPLTSGTRLRNARERLGLSIEDVAGELRLSVSQIKALEQDDYTELPGATYVRGYLRSYARLVKVDEDTVLPPLQPEPIVRSMQSIARPVQRQARSSDRWVRLMSYGLGILLIGLVIAWWRSQGGFDFDKELLAELPILTAQKADSGRTTANSTMKDDEPMQATSSLAETDAGRSQPQAPKLIASSTTAPETRTTPSAMGEEIGPSERASVSPPSDTAAAPIPLPTVPAAKIGKIVLKFSQASWAEIRDASNVRLLHQSFHAGREVEVEGTPPFSVFLGNAGGVRMEYNGKPFDITPHQTGLYARFIVEGAPFN